MDAFRRVAGIAAVMLADNVDTDIIFPAHFLLITARDGLGVYAFHDRAPARTCAQIREGAAAVLIAGANFGCGSSREQAVWALRDCGIRAIVAPSFGEIFAAKCLRNGLLPITLAADDVRALAERETSGAQVAVDLVAMTITVGDDAPIVFGTSATARLALISGRDETDDILNDHGAAIAAFEVRQKRLQSWLYAGEETHDR